MAPLDFTCGNLTQAEVECGEMLDRHGDHAATCPTRPWRNHRHSSLCEAYAEIFDDIGAYVRREVYVQEMSASDAILDVWAFGVAELPDLLVDVTVRHPACVHYLPAPAAITGYVAEYAEKEKIAKHPASKGRHIVPLAHETFGRLGAQAEDLLSRCAGVATRLAHRQGRLPPPSLRTWRARLDATPAKGVAAQLHASFRGTPGAPRHRHGRRVDAATIEERCPLAQ